MATINEATNDNENENDDPNDVPNDSEANETNEMNDMSNGALSPVSANKNGRGKRGSVVEHDVEEAATRGSHRGHGNSSSQSQSAEPPKVNVYHTHNSSMNSNGGYGSGPSGYASGNGTFNRRTSSSGGIAAGLSLRDRQASSPKMLPNMSDSFHNKDLEVVSHLARKYSTFAPDGSLQPPEMYGDSDNDGKDENDSRSLLSMHSKKSVDFVRQGSDGTLNGNAWKNHAVYGNGTFTNAKDEVAAIQSKREYFEEIFDEKIDPDKNKDVDADEFKERLRTMELKKSDLSDDDLDILFKLICGGDDDDDDLLNKDDFSDFLTRRYDAPTLRKYQEKLVTHITGSNSHARRRTLVTAATANDWNAAETDLEAMEMMQAMNSMVESTMDHVQAQQEWREELERRAEHPDFAQPDNALQWDYYEVACWISVIGFESVMKVFFDKRIDGSMLLYDLTPNTLLELGIKPMYLKKFQREVEGLRKKNIRKLVLTIEQLEKSAIFCPSERKKELEAEQKRLEALRQEFDKERKDYEAQILSFQKLQLELEKKVNALESEKSQIKIGHQQELFTLQQEHSTQINQLNTKLASLSELEAKYTALQSNFESNSSQLANKNGELLSLQTLKQTFESRIEKLEQSREEMRNEKQTIEEQNKSYLRDLDALKTELERYKLKLSKTSSSSNKEDNTERPEQSQSPQSTGDGKDSQHHGSHGSHGSRGDRGRSRRERYENQMNAMAGMNGSASNMYKEYKDHKDPSRMSRSSTPRSHKSKSRSRSRSQSRRENGLVGNHTSPKTRTNTIRNGKSPGGILGDDHEMIGSSLADDFMARSARHKVDFDVGVVGSHTHSTRSSVALANNGAILASLKASDPNFQSSSLHNNSSSNNTSRNTSRNRSISPNRPTNVSSPEMTNVNNNHNSRPLSSASHRSPMFMIGGPMHKNYGSSSLTNYVEQFEAKAKNDPNFGNPKFAKKWTAEEVALWLSKINCGYYIPQFFEQSIDGSMLLSDLSDDILLRELNVKRLHISKILRKISELREASELQQALQVTSHINELTLKPGELISHKRANLEQRVSELKTQNSALTDELSQLRVSSTTFKHEKNELEIKLKKAIKDSTRGRNHNNNTMAIRYAQLYLKEIDRSGIYKNSSSAFDKNDLNAAANTSLTRIHEYQDYRKSAEKCQYLLDKDHFGYDSDAEYVPSDIGHRPQRPIWPLLPTNEWEKYVKWYEGMFVKIMKERILASGRLEKAAEVLKKKDEKHKELNNELKNMIDNKSKFERKYEKIKNRYLKMRNNTSFSNTTSIISSDNESRLIRATSNATNNMLGVHSDVGSDASHATGVSQGTVKSRRSIKSIRTRKTDRTHKSTIKGSKSPDMRPLASGNLARHNDSLNSRTSAISAGTELSALLDGQPSHFRRSQSSASGISSVSKDLNGVTNASPSSMSSAGVNNNLTAMNINAAAQQQAALHAAQQHAQQQQNGGHKGMLSNSNSSRYNDSSYGHGYPASNSSYANNNHHHPYRMQMNSNSSMASPVSSNMSNHLMQYPKVGSPQSGAVSPRSMYANGMPSMMRSASYRNGGHGNNAELSARQKQIFESYQDATNSKQQSRNMSKRKSRSQNRGVAAQAQAAQQQQQQQAAVAANKYKNRNGASGVPASSQMSMVSSSGRNLTSSRGGATQSRTPGPAIGNVGSASQQQRSIPRGYQQHQQHQQQLPQPAMSVVSHASHASHASHNSHQSRQQKMKTPHRPARMASGSAATPSTNNKSKAKDGNVSDGNNAPNGGGGMLASITSSFGWAARSIWSTDAPAS